MKLNKHGLSRDIPALIKRTVRQECGFGCIFCGNAICQYEHIEPFRNVRDHIPKDIALLCGSCHDQVTRGNIAKAAVRRQRLAPHRESHPWPHSRFYPEAESFPVFLGGAQFFSPRTVLRILGHDLLSIREPEREDGPIRLSAEFHNNNGEKVLVIDENECTFNPHSWDIETSGNLYTIRSAPRAVALRIRMCPEGLAVERLAMRYCGVGLVTEGRKLKVLSSAANSWCLSGWVRSPDVGIEINRKGHRTVPKPAEPKRTIEIVGSGGDYKISGRQPANTEAIQFRGSARSLVIDVGPEDKVNIGGAAPSARIGFASSQRAAASLEVDDLEILVGAGARDSQVSYG